MDKENNNENIATDDIINDKITNKNKHILAVIISVVLVLSVIFMLFFKQLSNMYQMTFNDCITNDFGVYKGDLSWGRITGDGQFYFVNDDVFIGSFIDSKISGDGIYTFANDDSYNGQYVNGKREGQGTYVWADGSTFTGTWKKDTIDGEGLYTFTDGGTLKTVYKNGVISSYVYKCSNNSNSYIYNYFAEGLSLLEAEYYNGDSYSGGIDKSTGKFEGDGTYTWLNGDSYTGKWSKGVINGKGVFNSEGILSDETDVLYKLEGVFSNGVFVTGNYVVSTDEAEFTYFVEDGSFNDKIKVETDAGNVYSGSYFGGDLTGRGTIKYSNGEKYTGHIKQGKKSGEGTYTWNSGDTYTGEWLNDEMKGKGTYYFNYKNSSSKLTGNFKSNKPNGSCTYVRYGTTYYTYWSEGKMTYISKQ